MAKAGRPEKIGVSKTPIKQITLHDQGIDKNLAIRAREAARASPEQSTPKVAKAIRRQLGIAHSVLDVLVPKICLQSPRIVALVGQGKATGVP